ncbi:MAG TPA: glycosyltransferase family 4 protein, partial [Thermoanaerobaculia bacterium]|nr:glycosyltransferase family 4 protein [Thermoanaerobaculia bacterium]
MRFVFVSGNRAWGGSEELWSATAAVLASDGHHVTVFKSGVDDSEPRIRRLRALSCRIRDLARFPVMPRRLFGLVRTLSSAAAYGHETVRLGIGLALSRRPDLVVVSQGGNHDGYFLAEVCRRLRLPYAIVSHKASELYWPADWQQRTIGAVYRAARACFFVSDHTRRLTEEQLGFSLPYAAVVRNPFLVPWEPRADWPDDRNVLRLACIGRLHPKEKGQDLLLRVVARPRWRDRRLSVTFFGDGLQRASLERMAHNLGLANVTFAGFVRDVPAIWNDHHGLILPSRCEGLPITLVEAMLSGRVPIVTDVGGNAEIVDDGATGYIASAATEDALDSAMERAWNERHKWREIGAAAAARIRMLIPREPERVFAERLVEMVDQ